MEEIEVKILEIDRPALEEKLKRLGAQKHFDDEMAALFFDFPDRRMQAAKSVLRLRKEGKKIVLTSKKPISNDGAKIMEELEVVVDDFDLMKRILQASGFQTTHETVKHRTEYTLNGISIVFDKYGGKLSHIPEFIEIEAPNVAEMQKMVKLLGYKLSDAKSWDTYDIAKHYAHLEEV